MRIAGSPAHPDALDDSLESALDGIAPAPLGGREVAVGPVDDTPGAEIVTAAGRGETPQLRIFPSAGTPVGTPYYAFPRDVLGGVSLASCDVDGDGRHELVAPQASGGSDVRMLKYRPRARRARVRRVERQRSADGGVHGLRERVRRRRARVTGGMRLAIGPLGGGPGVNEIVAADGAGGVPRVQVFQLFPGGAGPQRRGSSRWKCPKSTARA
jgi:hypothetical protein